jgi:hypothetical protein
MLEIVGDKEGSLPVEMRRDRLERRLARLFAELERAGDRRQDERGVAKRGERASAELVEACTALTRPAGELEREAGLACAARPGDREQARFGEE